MREFMAAAKALGDETRVRLLLAPGVGESGNPWDRAGGVLQNGNIVVRAR